MSIKQRNRITAAVLLTAFFVLGCVANVTWNEPLSFTGTMVFSSLCIIWTVSIQSRITKRREKRYFTLLGAFMLLWMMERAVKFSLFLQSEWLERRLWYGYYIPILLMPLISLMIALSVGKTDAERLNPKLKLLYIPTALLIAGFMTNDLHQLAFRFNPGFENWGDDYSYGVLYYLALAWIIALVAAMLIIIVRFSTVNASKRRGMIPLAVVLISLAGVAVYIFTDFRHTRIMNVPELFCFCVAAFWESCLQTGLIPSNTGYDLLFNRSHLFAQVKDTENNVIYKTALEKGDGVFTEHSHAISGGNVTWLEDNTAVTEQKKLLEKANTELAQKAEIQQKENALKEERTRIEEQQKLYDRMNASFDVQTELIRKLVLQAEESEEKWKKNMLWVCIIGAYIKRKTNLMLLADKSETASLSELYLAYRESLSYLAKAGIDGEMSSALDIPFASGTLLYAYDEFEALIEKKMPDIRRVKIDIIEKESSVLFDIKIDETPLMFEFDKGVSA